MPLWLILFSLSLGCRLREAVITTPGLPLTIVRSYDSSNAREGDFGAGWSMAVNDLDVEMNENRSETPIAFSNRSFSMRTGGGWDVTLTLPDGRRTTFMYELTQPTGGDFKYLMKWVAEPGVTAKLATPAPGSAEQLGDNVIVAFSGGFQYWHPGGPDCPVQNYDIPKFILTLQDDTKYFIERENLDAPRRSVEIEPGKFIGVQAFGKFRVTKIERPNGEYLLISKNGIDHYLPGSSVPTRSLYFDRGVGNRIVAVRDAQDQIAKNTPMVRYEYDAAGNLVYVHKLQSKSGTGSDATYATTTYVYGKPEFPHFITEIIDPRGVKLARNTYYPPGAANAGKLQKVKTPDDRETSFTYEYQGTGFTPGITGSVARQNITDQESNSTIQETDARGNVLLTIDAKQNRTERQFDARNNLTSQTIKPATGTGMTTEYVLAYGLNDGVSSRIVRNPGGINIREDFDEKGEVRFAVDALHYVEGQPANATGTGYFYSENEYNAQGQPTKSWARGTGAPAQPISETTYYTAADGVLNRLPKETFDALLNRTSYSYYTANGTDGRIGDLKEVIQKDANGMELTSTTYKYDPLTGNRTEEDRRKLVSGVWTSFAKTLFKYDAQNRLIETTDALGGIAKTTYDSGGRAAYTTDRYGAVTHQTYDLMGRLVQTDYPDKTIARHAVKYLNFGGAILRHEIQEDRHFLTDAHVSGSRTIFDQVGRPIRVERLADINITFELAGEVGKTEFVSGTVLSFTETKYDFAGRVEMNSDANGKWTKHDYDDAGRQWRVRQFVAESGANVADTITTIFDYDTNGNQKWVLDPTQFATSEVQASLAGKATATEIRNAIWNNHPNRLTRMTHDNFNRLIQTDPPSIDCDPAPMLSRYDDLGRKWLSVDADGHGTAFVHDALGRLSWVVTDLDPGSLPTALPSPLKTTIPEWVAWARGNRGASDSTATGYQYDELGNLKTQTDANQHTTSFEYDALSRRTKRTLPGMVARPDNQSQMIAEEFWTHDYNSPTQGTKINQVRWRDFNGRYVLTSHDLLGRVTQRRPDGKESWAEALSAGGDQPVSFTYSGGGQRASMTDASGTTRYAYDDQNRLRIKQSTLGTIYYNYDSGGNVTEISARRNFTFAFSTDTRFESGTLTGTAYRLGGAEMTYQYDGRNRLWKTFSDPDRTVMAATYDYGQAGQLTMVSYANGVTTSMDHNARYQSRRVRSVNGAVIFANFDYDNAGEDAGPTARSTNPTWGTRLLSPSGRRNRLKERVNGAVQTTDYDYDHLNRVTQEIRGTASIRYDGQTPAGGTGANLNGYDPVGNRQSRRSTVAGVDNATSNTPFDPNDRLDNDTNPATGSALFDPNGNTTSFNGATYKYDFENRLITKTEASGTVTITYDGDGNRTKKSAPTGTTYFLVDNVNLTGFAQVLEEQSTEGGTTTVKYIFGLDLINQDRSGTVHYYGYDALGSVRYLTSGATPATVTDTYTYDAFGIQIGSTGNSTPNNYRYAGEQWDSDLGLYYLRARYYDPKTGRFWTMDTFEGDQNDPASLHKYFYTQNDPANRIDPSGNLDLQTTLTTFANIGYMAANLGIRAAPLLSRVTVVIFEAASGESVIIGGGAAITGYAALSRVQGGIGSWTKAVTALKGVTFGPYGYLKHLLKGSGNQAGHLNQAGAYTAMQKQVMACVDLGGNAFVTGTEHNQFHVIMERFWSQFRAGGDKLFQKVSNKEYLRALGESLSSVKDFKSGLQRFTQKQIDTLVEFAEKEQLGHGYHDGPGGLRPEVPKPMNLE